ncbi:mitochondrial acyl carrier protein [Malassezia brasiliensis]|uniref:Acyl carrier protein n=1 Tax=Malassezia brasiliensis TaxID=1821822 RepID=A0AAF0DTQ3_9BASI|nr:mitochondrial acyl carrier protein [Malassezia brasiliensis]
MLSTSLKMIPRTLRAAPAIARATPAMRMQVARAPVAFPSLARSYASGGGLSKDEIKTRIEDVLKSFEKVDPAQVTPTASFTGDLGLDSLDAVEVVMAIEEEFNIEIPDAEADNITTVQQAIDYIQHTPDAV